MNAEELATKLGTARRLTFGGCLKTLANTLVPGEVILAGTTANEQKNAGLLVATDRRLLFIRQVLGTGSTTDILYSAIQSITPKKGLLQNALIVATPSGRLEITAIKADDLQEIMQAIQSRRLA